MKCVKLCSEVKKIREDEELLKSYKTEIKPTIEQKQAIDRTIGVCRYVYNFYIAHNKAVYEKENRFVSGRAFSVWLNNEFIPQNPEYIWIKEVSSKAVKQSIMNADAAFRKFFRHQGAFPIFKKKGKTDPKMYFVKTDKKAVIHCERHRIKIPTIGWVRLKEMGIDLGLKEFATLSNGVFYRNINKSSTIKKLEKKLKREQKALSRKLEAKKREERGGSYSNIEKQRLKVQRLHQRLDHIRTDYLNKCVCEIAKTKPSYITIENLNVKGMMKNRHLSKAVANQKFYEFKTKLNAKCNMTGIQLRVVDTWYPSSKTCHSCGNLKKDLKLSERVFRCAHCGEVIDQDLNAALNLRDARVYELAN